MDTLSLCCAACIAFGDPASSFPIKNDPAGSPITLEALSAVSFAARSGAIESSGADGVTLDSLRIAVDASPIERVHLRAALDTNTAALGASEAFVEGSPAPGLLLRAGRFHVGPGAVSTRRASQRCYADSPLTTERFLGRAGLIDQGLQITYTTPYAVSVSGFVLSGIDSASFDAPYTSGMGKDLFGALLYGASLHVNAGLFMDHALSFGLGVLSGENGTGPDNRTDLIWADAVGRFRASADWSVGVDVEYLLRRYGIPYALVVEGGLSVDVNAFYRDTAWFGVRYDAFGLPRDPRESDHPYRVTTAAGYALTPLVQLRAQYSVRDDASDGAIAHEGILQIVAGWSGSPGVTASPSPAVEEPVRPRSAGRRPTRVSPQRPSSAPGEVLESARSLSVQGHPVAATSRATRAAQAACDDIAIRAGEPTVDRTCIEWLERLATEGTVATPAVWADARLLQRHALALASLGGRSADALFDRQTADDAIAAAARVLDFCRSLATPPAPKPEAPSPVTEPPVPRPEPAAPAPISPQA